MGTMIPRQEGHIKTLHKGQQGSCERRRKCEVWELITMLFLSLKGSGLKVD